MSLEWGKWNMKYTRLGDLLVGNGTITQEQLQEALQMQKKNGKRLGDVLRENHIITESQVIEALMTQLGLEFIDLNAQSISSEMSQILPKGIAKKYNVLPVKANRTELYLAMADPLNFSAIEEVSAATRKQVIPMIATASAVERAVQNLYSNQGTMKAIEDMRKDLVGDQNIPTPIFVGDNLQIASDDDDENSAPTIRLVNSIIDRAYTENASDIHLEPTSSKIVIRMRIDGVLRKIIDVPRQLQMSVISRIKIMAQMDIAKKNIPQDGRINISVQNQKIDLRVSSIPTIFGEKIVIRLLRRDTNIISIDGIGLQGENKNLFLRLLDNHKEGVLLVVGPTGSGKTSTMYTMINYKKSEEVNLISLEDPVEYHIDGVCQVQINEKVDLTFANALRAVLRQDPDIIAVGEIRDGETAEIAMRAAMTGHMVLTTIHTNDALSSIDRLLDIGVEPYLISGAVQGIISQRLVRKICPNCKKSYTPSQEELELLGLPLDGQYTFYHGKGCSDCFQTGYRGRTAVFEILTMTPEIRRAIHSRSLALMEEAVSKSTFHPIMENCADLVKNGVTTVEEILRVVGRE